MLQTHSTNIGTYNIHIVGKCLLGELNRVLLITDLSLESRNDEAVGVLGDLLGADLVAHQVHGLAGRADEGDASGLNHVHELSVLGQEAVSGVNTLRSSS